MKTLALVLFLMPLHSKGQRLLPISQHAKADSILSYFLGDEVFKRYVKLDLTKSDHSLFSYNFSHPKFSDRTFVMTLRFDSSGQFTANGLIRIDSGNDSTWISGIKALSISKAEKTHRIKKKSLRLSWDATNLSYESFQKSHNFRDISPGDLVWEIDGEVKFRGDRYPGTFQVSVFTGTLVKRFAIPWD